MRRFILLLATGLGAGRIPHLPGTAGTAVGVIFYLLLRALSPLIYNVTLVAFIFLAAWVATVAATLLGEHDPQKVVIDEVAGFLVTMAFVPFSWWTVVAGFILFRLFDIWKPFPCRWIERKVPAGWGIVGDDLMAGVYANLCLVILLRFLP